MVRNNTVADWLTTHPRILSVLWVGVLLLAEVGPVIAGNGSTRAGP